MSALFEKPMSSSDSLLSNSSEDVEAQIPQPEPLGTSKALSPAIHNKWWWRKKGTVANSSSSSITSNNNNNGSKSPPRSIGRSIKEKMYSSAGGSAMLPSDGKVGLVLGLLFVVAMTTLITVQFRDSELILALFTALALSVLGLIYYFHCCSVSSTTVSAMPSSNGICFWRRRSSPTSKDFSPIAQPSQTLSASLAGDVDGSVKRNAAVAPEDDSEEELSVRGRSKDASRKKSSSEDIVALPAAVNSVGVTKPSPHRRDWSLPALPTGGLLSHRRPASQLTQQYAIPQSASSFVLSSFNVSAFDIPLRSSDEVSKLRIEFSVEDPVGSRVQHVSNALSQLASATESIWVFEARLADAITAALTSCMSRTQLTEIKQALDRELRAINIEDRYSSLHAAIFNFLQKGERDAVLTHFSAVHHVVGEDDENKGNHGRSPKQRLLISDIDDTLVPTFKDRRGFSWGVPYPGVRQLYKELVGARQCEAKDAKAEEEEDEVILLRERVAFVTARPGLLRTWTRQEITKAGFDGSLILMGYATTATTPQGMLSQKVKQVRELRSLWPECSIVLVGDNGQRDIDLGALLLKENLVEAVFIHDIFASNEEITRTASTSFCGDDSNQAGEVQQGDAFSSPGAYPFPLRSSVSSSAYDENDTGDLDDQEDELTHFNLNDDRRLEAIQAKSMVRLISAPAALGSLNASSSRSARLPENSPSLLSSIVSHGSSSSLASYDSHGSASSGKKREVIVLEPSVPIGFRHDECSRAGIDLFQTYAGAALRCYQKGLLTIDALERVARACASDLGATSIDGLVKQRLVDSLLRDVARVALEFKDKTPSEKVEFLEFIHEAIKKRN